MPPASPVKFQDVKNTKFLCGGPEVTWEKSWKLRKKKDWTLPREHRSYVLHVCQKALGMSLDKMNRLSCVYSTPWWTCIAINYARTFVYKFEIILNGLSPGLAFENFSLSQYALRIWNFACVIFLTLGDIGGRRRLILKGLFVGTVKCNTMLPGKDLPEKFVFSYCVE